MDNAIAVFSPKSEEYKRLQNLANRLNDACKHTFFEVKTILFDAGQNIEWTTIVGHFAPNKNKNDIRATWQALTPTSQRLVLFGEHRNIREIKTQILRTVYDYNETPNKPGVSLRLD